VTFVTDLRLGRTEYTIQGGKLEKNVTPVESIEPDL
jgi:hypothetical protein